MVPERQTIERQILLALDATPSRVPVLVGGCGTGNRDQCGTRSQEQRFIGHEILLFHGKVVANAE